MLTDVLTALGSTAELSRVMVVSRDRRVLESLEAEGVGTVLELGRGSYRGAAGQAAAMARAAGARGLLILPADVPLVQPVDLDVLLAAARSAGVVLAPSTSSGTNALVSCPPGAIPFRFGRGSFQAHWRAAKTTGQTVTTFRSSRLELDVDEPDDLARFLVHADAPSASATWSLVQTLRIPERLTACCPDAVGMEVGCAPL